MIFQIELAGQRIEIHSLYEKIYTWCEDYIVTDNDPAKEPIQIHITQEDLEKEDRATQYSAWKKHPESIMVYHPAHLELFAAYRKISEIMPFYSSFLMHGSVIATENTGYMFAAPSGTGKTTRTKIWQGEYPGSIIINGDKPLLRVTPETVYACGTPWAGKEGLNTNAAVPLQAIYLLERTEKGEPDTITKVTMYEAFPTLYRQVYRPHDPKAMQETIRLLEAMNGKVDIYKLRCAPTAEAIHMAYEGAVKRVKRDGSL